MARAKNLGNFVENVESLGHDPSENESLFALVEDSIRQLTSRGKKRTAASVRSEMNRISGSNVSLEAAGFERFRDFLDAAEAAGRVTLIRPAPGSGSDTLVDLPGHESPNVAEKAVRADPIPKDVWDAFVKWNPGLRRFFVRSSGEIRTLPKDQIPSESETATGFQDNVRPEDEAYVEIFPFSSDKHLGWAQSFISESEISEALKEDLRKSLDNETPLKTFAETIKASPKADLQWRSFRLAAVREAIDAWMRQHRVHIELVESSVRAEDRLRRKATPRHAVHEAIELGSSPKDRILRVIAKMTLEELLELRLPARLLLHER